MKTLEIKNHNAIKLYHKYKLATEWIFLFHATLRDC